MERQLEPHVLEVEGGARREPFGNDANPLGRGLGTNPIGAAYQEDVLGLRPPHPVLGETDGMLPEEIHGKRLEVTPVARHIGSVVLVSIGKIDSEAPILRLGAPGEGGHHLKGEVPGQEVGVLVAVDEIGAHGGVDVGGPYPRIEGTGGEEDALDQIAMARCAPEPTVPTAVGEQAHPPVALLMADAKEADGQADVGVEGSGIETHRPERKPPEGIPAALVHQLRKGSEDVPGDEIEPTVDGELLGGGVAPAEAKPQAGTPATRPGAGVVDEEVAGIATSKLELARHGQGFRRRCPRGYGESDAGHDNNRQCTVPHVSSLECRPR